MNAAKCSSIRVCFQDCLRKWRVGLKRFHFPRSVIVHGWVLALKKCLTSEYSNIRSGMITDECIFWVIMLQGGVHVWYVNIRGVREWLNYNFHVLTTASSERSARHVAHERWSPRDGKTIFLMLAICCAGYCSVWSKLRIWEPSAILSQQISSFLDKENKLVRPINFWVL